MNNMESMKDWLVTKSNQILGGKETGSSFIRVVTPNNIPEFTIPGYGAAAAKAPGSTDSSLDGGEVAGGSASLPCSATTSPRLSPRVHSPSLSLPSQTTSKSAPVSPCKSPLPRLDSSAAQSSSALHVHGAQTNADPQAMAAISLPHFRKKTSYGFVTVSQSPHTRRKESLFHDADISPTNSPLIRKFSGKSFSDFTGDKVNLTRRASRRRNVQSVVAPLGVIPIPHGGAGKSEESPLSSPGLASPSSNSSPGGTPETVHRDLFEEKVENGLTRKSSRRNRMYYRRRSSLHGLDAAQGGEDGNDDSETSPDPSPGIRRRSNGTIMPVEVGWLKRKSAPAFMEGAHLHKPLVVKSFSCADDLAICKTDQFEINKLHAKLIAEEGELKLSMRYLPEKHSLRVVLLKAENLGGPNRSDQSINAFVRMCLMPGKVQKQTSSIIKHTKDPMFNEDFYFSDLTLEQLKTMKLRLKVLHKSHNLKRTEFLGEIQMPLNELDLLHERRMWKDLQPRIETEVGYFDLTTYKNSNMCMYSYYNISILLSNYAFW